MPANYYETQNCAAFPLRITWNTMITTSARLQECTSRQERVLAAVCGVRYAVTIAVPHPFYIIQSSHAKIHGHTVGKRHDISG